MGKAKGRAKKKKFGNRGPDGRAVPKKPKPAQQNDNSSPGSGDAPVDGADLMDVDEEGTAAANEDANDEEWCDEDSSGANGSSGGGQSILRFAHRSVASAAARAARNAAKKISPPALSRSQKFRNRKRLLGQETKDMARFMGAFLRRAQQEKQQQSEQEEVESSSVGNEVRPVEESAVNLEIAPPTGPSNDGSVCGHVETSSSCGSVGDMPITTGHGLLIEEWCSGQEMKDAEEAMDDICDTSSDGFLDGLDFSSSSSRSSSRSGGSSCAERGVPPCPLGKEAVDVGQETGANDEVGDKMRTTGVPVVADLLPPGPSRRSIRDGRFGGRFAAPTRRYDNTAGNNKGGTGRGNKVLAPEEVHDRSGVTAMQLQTNKSRRAVRRERVAQEGKIWTPAALARARDRTRKHWSRRKAELMETYRNAYDVLQKAEETNNYGSVVEDSTTMLDEAHLVRTTRVIRTVKHFLFLEIQDGVAKMEHSREAGKVADVDSRTVRRWVKEFCKGDSFVVRKRQYNKREPHSYIDDEDIRGRLREYIDRRLYRRKKDEPRLRIADVQKWINEDLLKEELAGTRGISRRTVHKWMQKLGFRWSRHHKCVYVDGHNRPDVVTDRRSFVELLKRLHQNMSIPVRVEETVMVATSRGEARQEGASDDSDVSGDERDSGARSETGDDEHINGETTGREPLLWPAVREVEGKKEYKHVRVYGDGETSKRVADDCTRVPFDPRDLAAPDSKGDYCLLPDDEVMKFYRPKKVKREALFWPAVRTVDDEDQYKHVRIHDPANALGRDCVRVQRLKECPCDQRKLWGKCSCYVRCECYNCMRKPGVDSTQLPFDQRDLIATDGKGDYRLLPDHEVLSLLFHDETTAKENDDGDHQWLSADKGAAMKVKGEGRAAHISDVIGVDLGQLQISEEVWGMMQEDKDAGTERSGKYFGRTEGEGEDSHKVKEIQDAVKVLKKAAADCEVLKTANDPRTAAVIMTVGKQHDGYWTSDRMCAQLPAAIAMFELSNGPHRQGVFIFDNSTGHNAYDDDALLAHKISLAPGGEKAALRVFEDDNGKTVHPTFQVGDTLLTDKKIFLPKTEAQKKMKGRKFGTGLDKKKYPVGTRVTSGSPLLGLNKGGEQMLKEMGLWRLDGERAKGLVKCCNKCKADNAASRQAIAAFNKGGEQRERVLEQARREQQSSPAEGPAAEGRAAARRQRCCMERVFSDLGAFKAQLNKVQQIFKDAGHVCIFLPKYHPELNAIERYWGYVKHVLRLHCEYSLTHMLKILPRALSGVPLEHIRAWSRVVWLYIEAYDDGMVGYLKNRELKEWHTHREATRRGDAVLEAAGRGKTQAEKDAAAAKALAASQECRTFSTRRAKRAFKAWKNKQREEEKEGGEEKEAENTAS